MKLSFNEARGIINKLENIDDGDIFDNIKNIFNDYDNQKIHEITNFIYRLDIDLNEIIKNRFENISIFEPFYISINNKEIILKHKFMYKGYTYYDLPTINLINRTYKNLDLRFKNKKPKYINYLKHFDMTCGTSWYYKYKIVSKIIDGTKKLTIIDKIKMAFKLKESVFQWLFINKKSLLKWYDNTSSQIKHDKEYYEKKLDKYNEIEEWKKRYENTIKNDTEKIRDYLHKKGFTYSSKQIK